MINKTLFSRILKEAIDDTPENIDKHVEECKALIDKIKGFISKYKTELGTITVQDVVANMSTYEEMLEKIKKAEEFVRKSHTKYFDIVEPYDAFDAPKNVKTLEDYVNKLDDLNWFGVDKLQDVLESLIESANNYKSIEE
jgi:hypothetical protein